MAQKSSNPFLVLDKWGYTTLSRAANSGHAEVECSQTLALLWMKWTKQACPLNIVQYHLNELCNISRAVIDGRIIGSSPGPLQLLAWIETEHDNVLWLSCFCNMEEHLNVRY